MICNWWPIWFHLFKYQSTILKYEKEDTNHHIRFLKNLQGALLPIKLRVSSCWFYIANLYQVKGQLLILYSKLLPSQRSNWAFMGVCPLYNMSLLSSCFQKKNPKQYTLFCCLLGFRSFWDDTVACEGMQVRIYAHRP